MSEYPLNVSALMIPYSSCHEKAERFLTDFKTTGGKFPIIQRTAVSVERLKNVRESIEIPDGVENYITGLRIGYGLNEQYELTPYFSPLYGVLSSRKDDAVFFDLSEKTGDLSEIIIDGKHNVYEVEGELLVTIMDNDDRKASALENLSRYRSDIRIATASGERPWNDNDIKSMFYPFQEILALYEMYHTNNIYFISTLEGEMPAQFHTMILSHLDPRSIPPSADHVADVGNMCPPYCSVAAFAL